MLKDYKMKDRLRQIRLDLGKSQKDMATFLEIGQATWQNYELGTSKPNAGVLEKLSSLGYSLDWLAKGTGNMKGASLQEDNKLSYSMDSVNTINQNLREEIFNSLLSKVKELYKENGLDISSRKVPVETFAFRESLNIASIANSNSEIISMIKLTIQREKDNILNTK